MSDLVSERIANTIVARLQNITTANGYTFDVESVTRPNAKATEWRPRHQCIIVQQGTTARNEELDCPGNPPSICYETSFNIYGFILPSDHATSPVAIEVNEMEAAMKQAVVDNSVHWVFMDGLSIFAEFGSSQPYISAEGDNQGLQLPLLVTYRVSELDPTEVRG